MTLRGPPTLHKLSERSLLRNEAFAIAALEDLPKMLFLPLFEEALKNAQTNILKAMVQAWPFPCLPLGALIKRRTACKKILEAALDGIDVVLAQKVRPRRWKLEVLDLRSRWQNSWLQAATMEDHGLPQAMCANRAVAGHRGTSVSQPLKVVIDLNLGEGALDGFVSHLFRRVQGRRGLLQLCCYKLHICALSLHNKYILEIVDHGSIQELGVHSIHCPSGLLSFVPYLGRMCNLRKLYLCHNTEQEPISPETKEHIVTQMASQLLKLECLQKLHMTSCPFLEGHVDKLLGSLKTPLDILSVTHCQLSESEWNHLPESLSTSQLMHLSLRSVPLTCLNPEPFRVLLVKVSATLVSLNLEDCGIGDFQVSAFLPALSQCSQLTTFNFLGNYVFMSTLMDLLCHTARLSRLSMELYPFPIESYDHLGIPQAERLAQHYDELVGILKAVRQPKMVHFATARCPECGMRIIYNVISACDCLIPA